MMYSLPSNTRVWNIEKYQRLSDIRNNPIAIEKKYMNDLLLQVNMNLKMISVVNNGSKLEEFCFSPLLYPHEVICKDMRVLFTTKSQKDGSMNGKFRVRFKCLENCQNFCSFLSNFLNILMYEDLQRRESQNPNFSTSTIQNASTSSIATNDPYEFVHHQPVQTAHSAHRSLLNRSFGESVNHSFNAESAFLDTSMNNESAHFNRSFSEAALNRSMEVPNFLNRSIAESSKSWAENKEAYLRVAKVGTDMSTQTEQTAIGTTTTKPVQSETQTPVVNVSIGSLISDAAMSKFTSMCESFFDRLFSLLETRWGSSRNALGWEESRSDEDDRREFALPSALKRRISDTTLKRFRSAVSGSIPPLAKSTKSVQQKSPTAKSAPKKVIEKKTNRKPASKKPSKVVQKASTSAAERHATAEGATADFGTKRSVPQNRKASKNYSFRGAPPLIGSSQASENENLNAEDYLASQICWY